MNWRPVTKLQPCNVCKRQDWCTRGELGSCCMRVKSHKRMRNGGWLHSGAPAGEYKFTGRAAEWIDAEAIHAQYRRQLTQETLQEFSRNLGVSVGSLLLLDVGWSNLHGAIVFPMRNETGKIIGMRTRTLSGEKKTISGTRNGLFCSHTHPNDSVVVVCEGPTDCAAMLTIGTIAIGRPSCRGSEELVAGWLKNHSVKRFVIVPDSDQPGIDGAKELQGVIGGEIIVPPTKDARAWVQSGLTRNDFLNVLRHRGLLPTVSTPPSSGPKKRGTQPCESPAGGNDLPGEAVASAHTTARAYLRTGSDPMFTTKSRLCRTTDNPVPRAGRFASVVASISTMVQRTTLVVCGKVPSVNVIHRERDSL